MSATDELRRMLDERGVEWSDGSDENVLHTTWNDMRCWFTEYPDGWTGWGVSMSGSPEQAIEATLGRGTCHRALDFDGTRYVCSACGENFGPSRWHFCPNCGRRCVG